MSTDRDQKVRQLIERAYTNAPAVRRRFDEVGLKPSDIQTAADLDKIPILPKDTVIALQQADPPFGGMLGVPMSKVRHIFMSPGPLYEPDAGDDSTTSDMAQLALEKSSFTPGDVVLNALSYHLVPAGLMLDTALTQMGCTVLPTGIGNSELQVKLIQDLGVTGYVGTPSFLMILIQKAEEAGMDFKQDLQLTKALVTAEPLPAPLRQTLVETYGITLGNAYATAELGFLAVNLDGTMAMRLQPEPVIQVVDPETGTPVGSGEAGEVVVTHYDHAYPLIRFGTGDMAVLTDPAPGQSRQEERSITLVGRSGEARKVRGMFVHPNQLRFAIGQATAQIGGAKAVQGVVSRSENRDYFVVRVALNDQSVDTNSLTEPVKEAVRQLCRVRADEVVFVATDAIAEDAPGMVDERSWD
ncbi:AMP-binding protein [Chloroflexi bacterium TSY]|nr:AMP-binding protein [Chloroflexi bacterium TSY]